MTHEKLLLGPVGALCSTLLALACCVAVIGLTEDGLLGAGKVNGLDTTGLLELRCDSRFGGSNDTRAGSVEGRDKGALLGRSSSQLPGGLAESTGSGS